MKHLKRILIINHHFNQDIDALQFSIGDSFELKVISADMFSVPARKHFPPEFFSGDLSEYHKEQYDESRKQWANIARKILYDIYMLYSFDAIVSPSDTFYYIRDVIQASREMGIPFVVLQKEHYMSPKSLSEHSMLIKQYVPFISDYMTVCSRMSKHFWELAGTPPKQIAVIGQPRFDFYKQPERWLNWLDLGLSLNNNLPTILFFSYDLGAYFEEFMITGTKPWLQLREETENILFDYVKKGKINLIIKPHPQQDPNDIEYVKNRVIQSCDNLYGKRILLLEGSFDTRQLIVNADIVVSFQTTALLEAIAVNKKVIYTFWTEKVKEVEPLLLPYHKYPEFIDCAFDSNSFREILDKHTINYKTENSLATVKQNKLIDLYLGPIDGFSSKRFFDIIGQLIIEMRNMQASIPIRQKQIDVLKRHRGIFLVRQIFSSLVHTIVWTVLYSMIYLFVSLSNNSELLIKIKKRVKTGYFRTRECAESLFTSNISSATITGWSSGGIIDTAIRSIGKLWQRISW